MVYNNPLAYGVDITPEMFQELADERTLVAIKESAGDIRRFTGFDEQSAATACKAIKKQKAPCQPVGPS